jgi:hypothetical protein
MAEKEYRYPYQEDSDPTPAEELIRATLAAIVGDGVSSELMEILVGNSQKFRDIPVWERPAAALVEKGFIPFVFGESEDPCMVRFKLNGKALEMFYAEKPNDVIATFDCSRNFTKRAFEDSQQFPAPKYPISITPPSPASRVKGKTKPVQLVMFHY